MTTKPSDKLPPVPTVEPSLTKLHQKIDAGVKAAIAEAIEKHRRLGQSICILKDGKVVTLTADEIPPMAQPEEIEAIKNSI